MRDQTAPPPPTPARGRAEIRSRRPRRPGARTSTPSEGACPWGERRRPTPCCQRLPLPAQY